MTSQINLKLKTNQESIERGRISTSLNVAKDGHSGVVVESRGDQLEGMNEFN